MKTIIPLLLLFAVSQRLSGQDYIYWVFKFSFFIEGSYDSLEIDYNEPFTLPTYVEAGGAIERQVHPNQYFLGLSFGCISCAYPSEQMPPEFFLKLYLTDPLGDPYSLWIPVTFQGLLDVQNSNSYTIHNLGTIRVSDFLRSYQNPEPLQGIRIHQNGQVEQYKQGQYPFPVPERLRLIRPEK